MACCCQPGKPSKSSASCLGRCDLPKHRCLEKEEVKPGPVPKNMGWLYTARDAPEHQLRCGWRPGHISCPVLRRIECHNGTKMSECPTCPSTCARPPCLRPCSRPCSRNCSRCCVPPKCPSVCPSTPSCVPPTGLPLIRIIRHAGQYQICTKPSNVSNAPSGPYPLKYVLDADGSEDVGKKPAKYSVEAKFNDYSFDYTSSQASFVLDFTPPIQGCYKTCSKKSILCMLGQTEDNWPIGKTETESTTDVPSKDNKKGKDKTKKKK